jgi:hypothetical protein
VEGWPVGLWVGLLVIEQKAGKPVAGGRLAVLRKAIKLGKSM